MNTELIFILIGIADIVLPALFVLVVSAIPDADISHKS